MGIKGLLPNLKHCISDAHLEQFRGQHVAVDTYAWLHKAIASCPEDLAKGRRTDKWITYMLRQIDILFAFDLAVTLVFDGDDLMAKKVTEEERAKKRAAALKQADDFKAKGKNQDAWSKYIQSVDVSPTMAYELIDYLRKTKDYQKVNILVAPYEADAQLAYLGINGEVDLIISEDSDNIAFQTPRMLFKLKGDGACEYLDLQDLYNKGISRGGFNLTQFDKEAVQTMCIVAGCDYLPAKLTCTKSHALVIKTKTAEKTLKNLGLTSKTQGRFYRIINETGHHDSLLPPSAVIESSSASYVNRNEKRCSQYDFQFYEALLTFNHQVVYCPRQQKCVHLTPLSFDKLPNLIKKFIHPDEQENVDILHKKCSFLGTLLPPDIARGVANGILDPVTKRPFVELIAESNGVQTNDSNEQGMRGKSTKKIKLPRQKNNLHNFLLNDKKKGSQGDGKVSMQAPASAALASRTTVTNPFAATKSCRGEHTAVAQSLITDSFGSVSVGFMNETKDVTADSEPDDPSLLKVVSKTSRRQSKFFPKKKDSNSLLDDLHRSRQEQANARLAAYPTSPLPPVSMQNLEPNTVREEVGDIFVDVKFVSDSKSRKDNMKLFASPGDPSSAMFYEIASTSPMGESKSSSTSKSKAPSSKRKLSPSRSHKIKSRKSTEPETSPVGTSNRSPATQSSLSPGANPFAAFYYT